MRPSWIGDIQRRHVYPLDDLREHVLAEDCWCRPDRWTDGDDVVVFVHNSMDGREAFETGERLPS